VSTLEYAAKSLRFPVGRTCLSGALLRTLRELKADPVGSTRLSSEVETFDSPPFDQVAAVFSRHALSLGSMELHSTFVLRDPIMCVHLREFEAPMSGAVHVTNRCDEILEYFEEGKEILCYGSRDELVATAQEYVKSTHAQLRARLREAARRRAIADHTWTRRFESILNGLGLNSRMLLRPRPLQSS
jgi:spore maturation protein CgeB